MKEAGKLSPRLSVLNAEWKIFLYSEHTWAYIAPKLRKITKIHGIPLLNEGYFRKITKSGSNGVNWAKIWKAGCEFSQPAKIFNLRNCKLRNFSQPCEILQWPNFFCFLLLFPMVSDMQY